MIKLPKQTWVYNEESNSFIPLAKNTSLGKVGIIISYNPPMGFNCKPQVVNRIWTDEYKQRCFTSVDLEECDEYTNH